MVNEITSSQIHSALYAADLLPNAFVDVAIPDRRSPRVLIGYFDTAYELVRSDSSYTVQSADGDVEFGLKDISLSSAFRGLVDLLRSDENLALDRKLCEMSL